MRPLRTAWLVLSCSLFFFGALHAQEQVIVRVTDNVARDNVPHLGMNLGTRSSFGSSVHLLKNLIPNPGFEAAEMGTVLISTRYSTSTMFLQNFWNGDWNHDEWAIGQPEGFWDGADYEIVFGPAAGHSGVVQQFTYVVDGEDKSRPTFVLDHDVPTPQEYDSMFVRKQFDSNYLLSVNGGFGGLTLREGDIDFVVGDTRPGSPGHQSMSMDAGADALLWLDSGWRDGDRTGGKAIIVRGDWKFSFWAKGEDPSDRLFVEFQREGEGTFIAETVQLTTEWQHYELPFSVPDGLDQDREYSDDEYHPILQMRFRTKYLNNPGRVSVDDAYLGCANETNPTAFSDAAVSRLEELQPGILRDWSEQYGASLDSESNDLEGKRSIGFTVGDRKPTYFTYGLKQLLELCEYLGCSPWYVIPPTFSPQEMSGLIDYLSGPTSTVMGARRAAQGHPEPWTDTFDTIYLEFANEAWGLAYGGGDPFAGGSFVGGERLGTVAHDRLGFLRANPAFDDSTLRLIIGGQAAEPARQGQINEHSTNHDIVAVAPYYYGSEWTQYGTEHEIYDPLYATPLAEAAEGGRMAENGEFITTTGQGAEPAIYEIQFHTTQSDEFGPPMDLRNDVITSQGTAMCLSQFMLTYMRELGVRAQCAFTFMGTSFSYESGHFARLWGLLRDTDHLDLKRPQFMGMELTNRAMLRDMLVTVHDNDTSWVQEPLNGIDEPIEVAHVQSFAFSEGDRYSVILFNLDRSAAREVILDVPGEPGSVAEIAWLANSDILASNEFDEQVHLDGTVVGNFQDNYSVVVPAHSMLTVTWTAASGSSGGDPAPTSVAFRRGDVNDSGSVDVADAVTLLDIVSYGTTMTCADAADVNDDEIIDMADPIALLGYLFQQQDLERGCQLDVGTALSCTDYSACP